MTTALAARLSVIRPSATIVISQRATELRAAGVDVVSFALGEPDFDPPAFVLDAAAAGLRGKVSHYTTVRGTASLRAAIAEDSLRRRGVRHDLDEIVVSVGAKHSLFNLALALFEAGDEVIVPTPCWVSYPEQAKLAGATPVFVETRSEEEYRLDVDALARAITPRTKALVLCTPSNPTGAAYGRDVLRGIAELARRHSFWIVADEIYGRLVYDGFDQASIASIAPDLRDRTVIVDGASKSFAMTGWRIGWMLAPRALAEACDTIQGQSTTNPTAIAQLAAEAALRGPADAVETMRATFERRRDLLLSELATVPGVRFTKPTGAFYVFADVRGVLGRTLGGQAMRSDVDIARYFLEAAHVATVPGSAFEGPGFVRLSYTTSEERIVEGCRRLRAALA